MACRMAASVPALIPENKIKHGGYPDNKGKPKVFSPRCTLCPLCLKILSLKSLIARFSNCGYNTALPPGKRAQGQADGAWRSPASALAWGARGPGFNSRRPDTKDSTSVESFRFQRAQGGLKILGPAPCDWFFRPIYCRAHIVPVG